MPIIINRTITLYLELFQRTQEQSFCKFPGGKPTNQPHVCCSAATSKSMQPHLSSDWLIAKIRGLSLPLPDHRNQTIDLRKNLHYLRGLVGSFPDLCRTDRETVGALRLQAWVSRNAGGRAERNFLTQSWVMRGLWVFKSCSKRFVSLYHPTCAQYSIYHAVLYPVKSIPNLLSRNVCA